MKTATGKMPLRRQSIPPVSVSAQLDSYVEKVLPSFDSINGRRLSPESGVTTFLVLEVCPNGSLVQRVCGSSPATLDREALEGLGFRETRTGRFERQIGVLPSAATIKAQMETAFAKLKIPVWTLAYGRLPKSNAKLMLSTWEKAPGAMRMLPMLRKGAVPDKPLEPIFG